MTAGTNKAEPQKPRRGMEFLRKLTAVVRNGFRTLMPTCQQVSRLQSVSIEQPQPFARRMGLQLHLMLCKWCRRYGRQIRLLHEIAHDHSDKVAQATLDNLSPEAQARLRRSLRGESQ